MHITARDKSLSLNLCFIIGSPPYNNPDWELILSLIGTDPNLNFDFKSDPNLENPY